MLAEELDSPWGDYLGVFTGDDSELVAYAGIKGVEEGDLMTLAVAEGWRRKGLGRSLTSDLLARAQARGRKSSWKCGRRILVRRSYTWDWGSFDWESFVTTTGSPPKTR